MSNKQETLTSLRTELDRWDALLDSLSEAQIIAPTFADGWSVQDVVAHLHAWQLRSVARLDAAANNHELELPNWPKGLDPEEQDEPDALNAWLYQQFHDLPWSDVRQRWHDVYLRIIELGAAIPEADLLEVGRYPWLKDYALIEVLEGTLEHHQEHAAYVLPLLPGLQQAKD